MSFTSGTARISPRLVTLRPVGRRLVVDALRDRVEQLVLRARCGRAATASMSGCGGGSMRFCVERTSGPGVPGQQQQQLVAAGSSPSSRSR